MSTGRAEAHTATSRSADEARHIGKREGKRETEREREGGLL